MFIVSNQVILPVQNISYKNKTVARKRAINDYFSNNNININQPPSLSLLHFTYFNFKRMCLISSTNKQCFSTCLYLMFNMLREKVRKY